MVGQGVGQGTYLCPTIMLPFAFALSAELSSQLLYIKVGQRYVPCPTFVYVDEKCGIE